MFCIVYQWKVKPEKADRFRELWRAGTEAAYSKGGSFGSRLHQCEDGTWIAYAQWPDKETWKQGIKHLAAAIEGTDWADCLLEEGKTLHLLNITDDLLKTKQFAAA